MSRLFCSQARHLRTCCSPHVRAFFLVFACGLFSYNTLAETSQESRKSVLILSGTQYGLPISDRLVAGAVSALEEKGVSANDLFVENLDIVRNGDPRRRAVLANDLRDKLAKTDVGIVIVANQTALQFLAQEG